MSRCVREEPKRFCAVKKWRDGRETVEEYFTSVPDALEWIRQQTQSHEYHWCVGEFDV